LIIKAEDPIRQKKSLKEKGISKYKTLKSLQIQLFRYSGNRKQLSSRYLITDFDKD
jgi:hypothetical protein